MSQQDAVIQAVREERAYQNHKWGSVQEHKLSQGEWLLVLEQELAEAKQAWAKNAEKPHSVLDEVRQVAAVAVACMEQHGYWFRDPAWMYGKEQGKTEVKLSAEETDKERVTVYGEQEEKEDLFNAELRKQLDKVERGKEEEEEEEEKLRKWNEENVGVHGSGKGAYAQLPRSLYPPPVPESMRERVGNVESFFGVIGAEKRDFLVREGKKLWREVADEHYALSRQTPIPSTVFESVCLALALYTRKKASE